MSPQLPRLVASDGGLSSLTLEQDTLVLLKHRQPPELRTDQKKSKIVLGVLLSGGAQA